MKTLRISYLAFTMALLAGLLSACRDKAVLPVLETVPDNAVTVEVIDFRHLLNEAGCAASAGSDTLTGVAAQIVNLVVEPDMRQAFAALTLVDGGVDLGNVTTFTTSRGEHVVVMHVGDQAVLRKALTQLAGASELHAEGELGYVGFDGAVIAFDESWCWIAPDMTVLRKVWDEAAKSHIGALEGVHEFLSSGDGVAKLAVNCARSPLEFLGGASRWLCVGFNVSEVSVTAEATVIDREGVLDSIGRDFDNIDLNFLKYTPADAAVVLAFGKFDGNEHGLAMLLGRYAPVYLAQADGTTSLYAVPASGNVAAVGSALPGSWNVETMVHLPDELLAEGIRQYKERAGSSLVESEDNQWSYRNGDDAYYFGAFDGSLVFSTNRAISDSYNNEFADAFLGLKAAMVVDIPVKSVLARAWGLPYGLTFRMSLDETRLRARIVFHGSDDNALVSLLKMPQLPDFHERFRANTGM